MVESESSADPRSAGAAAAEPRATEHGAAGHDPRPFRRALVVANPISGRGKSRRAAAELAHAFRATGTAAELFETGVRGDAFTRLRCLEEGVELVVAVGGDGTLREVLQGLVDPEIPVGLLPYGTANVLAGELRLPRDVHLALEILRRRKLSALDVARVNGQLSFLMTGVGIDAVAVRHVEARRRGPITKLAYADAVVRALARNRPPRLLVTIDGERLSEPFGYVLVSNARRYAGLLRLAHDARLDDGRLEIYLFPTGSTVELAVAFARGFLGRLPGGAVQLRHGRRVTVESDEATPVPWQIDGDAGGVTPVEIALAPYQHRLVVP